MSFLQNFLDQWTHTPSWIKLVTLTAVITSGAVTVRFRDNYKQWKAMGPGGLPYDIRGYAIHLLAKAFVVAKEDTWDITPYDHPEKYLVAWKDASTKDKSNATKSFLSNPLPRRKGPQARALPFVVPHREKNENERRDPEIEKTYLKAYDKLVETNAQSIEWKTSVLEKRGKAMFLLPSIPMSPLVSKSAREIGHIHASDLSAHVMLSLEDSRQVIEKGWGERHGLSGTKRLSLSYLMLYSPRSVEEVEILINILQAGIDYVASE
ncbi:Hypothetical protein R9X50_00629100 [Acrodontium crateriforme]|uniref:Luciferase domain-containing protein n=1 Tax=Acrodontium crateriforme TaxID=150365 RepID=A0AAQ3R6P7_9PEZI|nr:Hypothetical protein R9X50_00629100 [Acrodontium crateriforme]